MTTLFDSEVYARRRATPYTQINLVELLKDLALMAPVHPDDIRWSREATLSVHRADVATRFWWTLKWKDEEGEHLADGQELQLCLWRAAAIVANQERQA